MPQLRPIFIGGTRRSGSTVTGYLVGSHPDIWCTKPRELRFVTDDDGLLDLVLGRKGRLHPSLDPRLSGLSAAKARLRHMRDVQRERRPTSPADFERGMYGRWWSRLSPEGEPRGLHRGVEESDLRAAMDRFDASLRADPASAAARLVHELLDKPALANGARAWADTTPQNAENAHRLVRLFPDAKVVFMLRDGRDTVASVLDKAWGPEDPLLGLEWWRASALRAAKSMAQLTPEQGLTLRLGRLINTDREESLQRLFDFLGHEITPSVREFFDQRMSPRAGNVHRWQRDIPDDVRPDFEARYAEIWKELTDIGLDLPAI